MKVMRKTIIIMVMIGMVIAMTGIVDAGKQILLDTPREHTGNHTDIKHGVAIVTLSEVDFGEDYDIESFSDARWGVMQDINGTYILKNPILAEYVVYSKVPAKSPGISSLVAILGLLGVAYLKRRD